MTRHHLRTTGFAAFTAALWLALTANAPAQSPNLPLQLSSYPRTQLHISSPPGAPAPFRHQFEVWVADTPEAFAAGIATLIKDPERREQIARAAYGVARRNFDWSAIGERQRDLLR